MNLANQFRRLGIAVVIEMNNKKIKKCFEWANKQAIPFVSVIGEDEMKDQKLKIKKMSTGEIIEVPFSNLDCFINKKK